MKFDTWIVKPTRPFIPTHWADNPAEAELVVPIVENKSLQEAQDTARGFNEREMQHPLGVWAVVLENGIGHTGMIAKIKSSGGDPKSNRRNPLTPSFEDFVTYKHFVVCAVVGLQQQADQFIRQYRARISRVAAHLRTTMPLTINPLYRGLLLDPASVIGDKISGRYQGAEYASFSEDLNVACWFAGHSTFISEEKMKSTPTAVGYIAMYTPKIDEILFHYSWADWLNNQHPNLYVVGMQAIAPQAQMDPQDLVYQLQWNLKTQKEVSTKVPTSLTIKRATDMNCPSDEDLDVQFTIRPDWIMLHQDIPQAGLKKGQKVYIKGVKRLKPPRTCKNCRQNTVDSMYFLEHGLTSFNCSTCGAKELVK